MTASAISKEIGIAPSTYSEFENGKRQLDSEKITKLREILSVEEDELREASLVLEGAVKEDSIVYNTQRIPRESGERELATFLLSEVIGVAESHDLAVKLINLARDGDSSASSKARLILEILETS